MNVTGTSAIQQTGQRPSGRPPGGGAMKAGMDAAADTLGLSKNELRSALKSGATLQSLADTAGVSNEELKTSMSEAINAAAPSAAAERLTADLDSIIAGRRPPPPPRAQKSDVESAASQLADVLGASAGDVLASIEDGSVAALFEQAGVEAEPGVLVDLNL